MTVRLYDSLESRLDAGALWSFLQRSLGLPETPTLVSALHSPTSTPLDPAIIYSLEHLLGTHKVYATPAVLSAHATGRTYTEYLRQHNVHQTPGAVVYPENEGDIALLMSWSAERDLALLPWGGGVDPYYGKPADGRPLIVVDMERMSQVLFVDEEYRQVRVQAGVRWTELERLLTHHGLSAQQYYLTASATVGGTLAVNALNLKSPAYGSITETVQAIRALTPAGPLHFRYPQPLEIDKRGLLIGTHGSWGIVTEVTLRLFPCPAERLYLDFGFAEWESALMALWSLLQAGVRPAWARVAGNNQLFASPSPLSRFWHGLPFARQNAHHAAPVHLTLSLEGGHQAVLSMRNRIQSLVKGYAVGGGATLQVLPSFCELIWDPVTSPVRHLWRWGVLADVLMASVPWPKVNAFRQEWEEALQSVLQATGEAPALALTTIYAAEAYAVLYTLLLGRQVPAVEEKLLQVKAIHTVAQETKQRWGIDVAPSPLWGDILAAMEGTMDPLGVMLRYRRPGAALFSGDDAAY